MKQLRRIFIAVFALAFLFSYTPQFVQAEAPFSLEQEKNLLQQSLTIYEIDKEVNKLSQQQIIIHNQIKSTEVKIKQQQMKMESKHKQAGKVLQAYYLNDRPSIWLVLLSSHSLSDALLGFEYLQMSFENDQKILTAYTKSFQDLSNLRQQEVNTQNELDDLKSQFQQERTKLVSLQTTLKNELKQTNQADRLKKQMEQLTQQWKTEGLPLFENYLNLLEKAMNHLPDLLSGKQQNQYLVQKGLQITFQISDQQFNQFLQQQNDIFKHFSFQFKEQYIYIAGQQNNNKIAMKGHYSLDIDQQLILFHIDELSYNGYELPASTRQTLENKYDLSFSPKKVAPFLKATKLKMDGHVLKVSLVLSL